MNKFAEIIPYLRLPKSLGIFDYGIKKEHFSIVKVGQLVKIPFRNRNILGLVVKIKDSTDTPKGQLKEISEILDLDSLPSSLVKLIFWLSDYYYISPALAFKTTIPKIVKQRKKIESKKSYLSKLKLTSDQEKIVKNIISTKKNKFLLIANDQKTNIYCQLIEKTIKKGKQVILLYPEIGLTNELQNYYLNYFGRDKVVVFHSQLSAGQYFTNWQKVQLGEAKVIIGTRQAIFAPVNNLSLIIVDSEHDSSYKQWDQNPRYHAVEVAEKISEIHKSKLVLSSLTPLTEKYYQTLKDDYKLIMPLAISHKQSTSIIDMREEIKKGNYSVISEKLLSQIKETLNRKKKVILFSNRRGSFSYVMCRDCGYIPKCPNCQISYSYHYSEESDLVCHHCLQKETLAPFCPKCHGSRYKFVGAGILKISSEIKKLIQKTKVAVFDAESKEISKDFDILITTQAIFNQPNIKKVDLVGILNIDLIINLPDFRAAERAWQIVGQLKIMSKQLIIQTYNPEYFRSYDDFDEFYQNELSNRELLNYPPYSQLIKLIYNHQNNLTAKKEAVKLINQLRKIIRAKVEVLGPLPAFIPKVRGRFRWYIILKLPLNISNEQKDKLLGIVPDNWLIDINPDSLL